MTKTKGLNQLDETVVSEALTRQVATILLGGASPAECAKKLSITPAAVRRIQSSDKFKDLVKVTAEEELAPALAKAKAQLARLSTKAVAVVEKTMDLFIEDGKGARDALQAAAVVLKSVGLHEEESKPQDTNLTIIMPGGAEPKTYEVSNAPDDSAP